MARPSNINKDTTVTAYLKKNRKLAPTQCEYCYNIPYKGWRRKLWLLWQRVKPYHTDEYGWQIGSWKTPVSAQWHKESILRCYGIKFDCKYNTICLGRLEIRIWKPIWARCGIYYTRDMRQSKRYLARQSKERAEKYEV